MHGVLLYQMEVMLNTWPVFDKFRGVFFIGEMIWNFADYQTAEGSHRNNMATLDTMCLSAFWHDCNENYRL